MKIVCDNCSTKYSIADEKVRGKVFKIKCKKCSHIIVVKGDVAPDAGFEQKDTRVFDYSGFEGGRDGGAGQDAVWHLVIDREQVGPLTIAEVQTKLDGGEADAETYVWREGFADWQRLGSVEELAALAKPREAEPKDKGLFGKAEGPADLFGAASAVKTEEAPADLFGAGAEGPSPSPEPVVFSSTGRASKGAKSDDMFAGAEAMAAAPSDGGGRGSMTGQRNENSVLFSLNNLASLATDSPKASSSSGSSGASSGGSSGILGATQEGSGLIDIRAMAAMTLGGGKPGKEERAMPAASGDDDLPVFSASAFSAPASGVLLPQVTAQPSSNRMIYVLVGFVAVLALAAIGLVVFILTGKKEIAVPPGPEPSAPVAAASSTSTAPAVQPPAPTVAQPTPTPPTSAPTPPPTAQPPPPPTAATPPAKPPEKKPKPTEAKAPKETVAKAPAPPKEETPPEPPPAAPGKQPKCDEVACLVTPDLPCCPKKAGDRPRESAAASNVPDKLDQPDIIAGMKGISARVQACNDTYRVAGSFKVKVTVAPDGGVTAAGAQAPMAGTPTGACVEKAVRGARFKKTKNPITFNYPYNFR